ncbi:MAG: site-specific DNA-methyltransferase [Candidatus Omnitrophota bacterium]
MFVKEENKYNYYLSLDKLRLPISNLTIDRNPEDILGLEVKNSLLKENKLKGQVINIFKNSKGDIFAEVLWENKKTTIELVQDFSEESQLPVELVCQGCKKIIKNEMDINAHYICKEFPKPILPPQPDLSERIELKPSVLFPYINSLTKQSKRQDYKGKFKLSPDNRGASPGARKSLFGEYLVLQRRYKIFQSIIAEYLRFWRRNGGITTKEIDKLLGYRDTAGHWFRRDTGSWGRGGSIPLPNDWFRLKEILKFDALYDRWVTETHLVLQTVKPHPKGKNPGDVWSIKLQPFPEAHFATFPEELVKRCIEAGCPEGGVVLDPFAGSGTVGKVANDLGRNAILIELVPEYLNIIKKRCLNIREVIYVK